MNQTGSFKEEAIWSFALSGGGRGKPCGNSFINPNFVCRVDGGNAVAIKGGSPLYDQIDDSLNDKFAPTEQDLKMFAEGFERAVKNDNKWIFPFEIPEKYNDESGTPEALEEIVGLRGSLKQDKKTGKISVPAKVKLSDKARELIKEYNELDLGLLYNDGPSGLALNVNGLGVMAGPRHSVPKDSIRGMIQYYALRRQDASLIDGPNGKIIDSYRDPYTGSPRRFYGTKIPKSGKFKGQEIIAILGSQDHWDRAFGVYGLGSENDVKNTVFMPFGMNTAKGEMSPTRFAYSVLAKNGMISDKKGLPQDASVVGGFAARFAKAGEKYDFRPKAQSRDVERAALAQTATSMMSKARSDVITKYIPKIEKDLASGQVSAATAAKHAYSVAKQEAERNYFGGYRRFTDTRVIGPGLEPYVKGVDLNGSTSDVVKAIENNIKSSGVDPNVFLQNLVADFK